MTPRRGIVTASATAFGWILSAAKVEGKPHDSDMNRNPDARSLQFPGLSLSLPCSRRHALAVTLNSSIPTLESPLTTPEAAVRRHPLCVCPPAALRLPTRRHLPAPLHHRRCPPAAAPPPPPTVSGAVPGEEEGGGRRSVRMGWGERGQSRR